MKLLCSILIILFLSSFAFAFNCGPDNKKLATEGMSKYQVLKDCGRPTMRQFTYYYEEWVYIVESYGIKQMYLIKINGRGVVADIEWLGEVK